MIGTRIGSYEIVSTLGAGGMGEVYRAHDHRLGRDVALKTLPALFSHDPDRLSRFEREAKTLASLNHPNIASIYGIEDVPATKAGPAIHALVMELVPGRTLAEVLEPPASVLAVTDVIAIGRQIALALEAAHDAGIIHRDLKPANVKVTDDDIVKVLDFGLARAGGSDGVFDSDHLGAATITSPAVTRAGVILGTAAYMAPEQARGKAIDKRADIWAFGVVLYEMLTRRRLFDGETVSDVIAQVLTSPIDFSPLPAETPPRVRELLARCLERDPKRRLRDIGEARIALSDPAAASDASMTSAFAAAPPAAAQRETKRSVSLPWVVAAAAVVVALALGIDRAFSSRPSVSSGPPTPLHLEIGPPPEGDFVVAANAGAIIISPDATTVAFLVQTSAGRKLFVRSLATGETHAVAGAIEPSYPFWSPDSRKIGYFGIAKLYTVDIAGGLPEAIADIEQGRGGAWTDSGVILFTPNGGGTIHRVSEHGGAVADVTKLDPDRGENAHYWPVALPGGRKFLYFVRSRTPENNGIYIGAADGSLKPARIVTSLSSGLYAPPHDGLPGRLLWVRDGNLLAQAFDVESGALSGQVTTLASDVRVEESQRGTFAGVARDGTLVWASARAADFVMTIVDRAGGPRETLPIAPGKIVQPAFSPDDRRLSFTRASNGTADIWTYDFASKEVRPVTTDNDYDEAGAWSPDSRAIFYQGRRDGMEVTLIASVDSSRPEQVITRGLAVSVGGFGRDGRSVFITRGVEHDIALIRLSDPTRQISVSPDAGIEVQPALSPDGRWLAFVTQGSGLPEVTLAPFQDDGATVSLGAQRIPVSAGGGVDPHWRSDGKEIVYAAPDASLRAVSVSIAGTSVAIGRPTRLPVASADAGGFGSNWGVNSTHTRFVILDAPRATRQTFRVMLGK